MTITYTDDPANAAGTWTETMWSIVEVANVVAGDPDDAPVAADTTDAGGTSLAIGDVGTPGTDDVILCGFTIESDGVSAVLGQGTELSRRRWRSGRSTPRRY